MTCACACTEVVRAARACAAEWRTWSRPHTPPVCRALMDAVDAHDAPAVRYIVSGSDVMCNNTIYDTVARREVSMLEVCHTLNAAERTP